MDHIRSPQTLLIGTECPIAKEWLSNQLLPQTSSTDST